MCAVWWSRTGFRPSSPRDDRRHRPRSRRPRRHAAAGLLGYLLEEIGPSIYNQAVADVQERLQHRVSELDIEVHEDEFGYWRKFDRAPKTR